MDTGKITFAMAADWDRGFINDIQDPQDLEQFRSEKSVTVGKSPEEIKQLSVDENLGEMDRSCLLLTTGQDIQKICVIMQLPQLLKLNQMETLCRVIPKFCDLLPTSSDEVQVAASCMLMEVVSNGLIPIHIFITTLLSSVLSQYQSRDPTISAIWLKTVLSCIPFLPKEEIKKRILTIAIANGQLSQTIVSRQASCHMLGEIAPRFDSIWLKRELLPLASSLCQDVAGQVRQLMCLQLSILAKALGVEVAEACVIPELVELLCDEESQVRVAALEVVVELISFWSEPCLSTIIKPLILKFCNSVMKTDDLVILEGVAQLLGKLCHELKAYLNPEEVKWYVKLYKHLADRPHKCTSSVFLSSTNYQNSVIEEITRLCAYNFPAMLLFTGGHTFKATLSVVLDNMTKDDCWRVRRTIACGIHEVLNILGKECLLAASTYHTLLRDSSIEVLEGLVSNLSASLTLFADASNLAPETRQPGLPDFINPLLACAQKTSSNPQWRIQRDLVNCFKTLIICLTSDQIYTKFVPLLYELIAGLHSLLPVRLAAAETLCHFVRHNRRQEQRSEICTWIIEECATSRNCHKRMLFLEICHYVLDISSRNFFKNNFFDPLLHMAMDPVVNIRLRLCRLLPALKSILKLPIDRSLLQRLEQTVRRLISHERDPDASHSIRVAVLEMDKIEVAMESLTRQTYFEADIIDQKREEEEQELLLAEEREQAKEKLASVPARQKVLISKGGKSVVSAGPATSPSIAKKNNKTKSSGSSKSNSAHSAEVTPSSMSPAHNQEIGKSSSRKKMDDNKSYSISPVFQGVVTRKLEKSKSVSVSPVFDGRIGSLTTIGASGLNGSPSMRLPSNKCLGRSKDAIGHGVNKSPTTSTKKKSPNYALEYSKPKKKT